MSILCHLSRLDSDMFCQFDRCFLVVMLHHMTIFFNLLCWNVWFNLKDIGRRASSPPNGNHVWSIIKYNRYRTVISTCAYNAHK
jgi:hypothetical protein